MALTVTPTYPVVDVAATVTSTLTTGNVEVLAITSVPSGSTYSTGLVLDPTDDPPTSALRAAELDLQTASIAFDEPGEYGVTVYDISELPGLRGSDNSGSERRFVLNGSDSGTVHVGAIVDLPIRTIGDARGATLRLQINDTTVRVASLVNPTDEAARVSALLAAVTAALSALVGQTAATMGNDLIVGTNDLRANYEAHRVDAVVHPAADTTNTTDRDDADSLQGAFGVLNRLRIVIQNHQQDTLAAGPWHNEEDHSATSMAAPANSLGTATVLLADLRERVYEVHRLFDGASSPACHAVADAGNALTAVTLLDTAITSYLDALRTTSPPVLAGEPEGAHDAANNFGFAIQDS